jgi:glycosyltransferase involved in cell wall biosynthesis
MRILIATTHRNLVGGVEKYLRALLPGLAARGHQIGLLYENLPDAAMESVDSPEVGLSACCVAEAGWERALLFAAEWKPDVVYSHGLTNTALQTALLDKYPNVLYAHNYLGTCATGQKCHAFPVPQPCNRRFGPACLLLHYPRRCGGMHPGTMFKMFWLSAEMNRHLPNYRAVLVASAHMRREFQRHGVLSNRLHLVPLPNTGAVPSNVNARATSRDRVLFVGRLTKLKGVAHLFRAIPIAARKLARPLSVTVAGSGPERRKLQALAHELAVTTEFLGWVPSERQSDLLREADLLAVPSLWPEPFGLVGIEAGAHGLPAVAYNVGGISDWLIAGQSGELAPGDPPTVEGLADAIVRALSDPDHYSNLCRGARQVSSRFNLDVHLSRLEDVLATAGQMPPPVDSTVERIHA